MRHLPVATYRIQFNNTFGFSHLSELMHYLKDLGISTIYASPIFSATPGSMHGYDVTDSNTINPEIGTLEEFRVLSEQLQKLGMNWLQDIVPNHMAFSGHNLWLKDLFERGRHSAYYGYFDLITDPSAGGPNRVMVPFLGKSFPEAVEEGSVHISFSDQGFLFNIPGDAYPLSADSVRRLGNAVQDKTDLSKFLAAYPDPAEHSEHWQQSRTSAIQQLQSHQKSVEELLKRINSDPQILSDIHDQQYYRFCRWDETNHHINFRRFFTVNALICLAMERPEVVETYHALIIKLVKEGLITGLRIDHVDGLKDPETYLRSLRSAVGKDVYLIIEKILTGNENLPEHWTIDGTSGYEFLSFVNQLLTNREGAEHLRRFYLEFTGEQRDVETIIYDSKKSFLHTYMAGELDNLTQMYIRSGLAAADADPERIKTGLAALMCAMPVYRIYPDGTAPDSSIGQLLKETIDRAVSTAPEYRGEIEAIGATFFPVDSHDSLSAEALHFVQRLMQFTGPLTAKGVEDTIFYTYNPLISHNEVGDSPERLGMSAEEFHKKMIYRSKHYPRALNATSTHDTKRGEDSRMRINLLSEYAPEWTELVQKWEALRMADPEGQKITANDAWFIYQSLLGGFPETLEISDKFIQRVKEYCTKALREAKANTTWESPNAEYEAACHSYITTLLQSDSSFISSLIPFVKRVINHAETYSLHQTLIKLTAPGIPDTYQGAELWDLSFVDPDNRSEVDYAFRMENLQLLKELEGRSSPEEFFARLQNKRNCGLEKLFLIKTVLKLRNEYPDLFNYGNYIPLTQVGGGNDIIGYCRNYKDEWLMVICPLDLVRHVGDNGWNYGHAYNDTIITALPEAPVKWINRLTGDILQTEDQFTAGIALASFPVGLFMGAR